MDVKKSVFLIFSCILIANSSHAIILEFDLHMTDLLLGRAGSCFTAEQAQEVKKAYDEKKVDQIADFLAPFVQAKNAEAITSLAIIEFSKGNSQIAQDYFVQAMKDRYALAMLNLGHIFRVVKNYNDAEWTLQLAVAFADPRACFELALLFTEKNDTENMKKYLHIGADKLNDPFNMEKLGTYYLICKNYELAKQYFRKCIDYMAHNPVPPAYINKVGVLGRSWSGLGYAYTAPKSNDLDRAIGITYLHTAADMYNDADACYLLFAHYCDSNDAKKALFYFEKWPQDPSSSIDDKRLHLAAPCLARLYQKVGNKEQAEKYAQMAKTD